MKKTIMMTKNKRNRKSVVTMSVAMCLTTAFMADAAETISNSPRRLVTVDTEFAVSTDRVNGETYPIATRPMFSFDCSRTNGWTIGADGRVSRVPNLEGGSRYLTSDLSELRTSNYLHTDGTTEMWVGNWKYITAPTLQPASDGIQGPYLDFGAIGSKICLFFDPVDFSGTDWNKLTGVGTVVGVYKSNGGGGQLLGGKNYRRNPTGLGHTSPILYRGPGAALPGTDGAEAVTVGGELWQGLRRNGVMYSYWSCDWEVVVHNPNDLSLEAHGVGFGNCQSIYGTNTSGGQSIAELMIFAERLSDDDVRKLVLYLNKKWLPSMPQGYEGKGRLAGLTIREANDGGEQGYAATIDVPANESLTVDRLRGGRGAPEPSRLVKTGAGALTLNDAAEFGGTIRLQAGSLTFSDKKVPTLAELPAGMTVRLDASDTSADYMTVEDGRISSWKSQLWSTWNVAGANTTAGRRPLLVENALNGKPVLDFGSRNDGTWAYFTWSGAPKFAVVFAVIDARIQGGGHLMDGNLQREATWHNRNLSYATKFFNGDAVRAVSKAWVNGRLNDNATDGYEVPSWQVVAMSAPTQDGAPYRLGGRQIAENNPDAGGMRIAEIIGYSRPLSDEEVRDVAAYLMKKWLNRSAPGYEKVSDSDVADLQEVEADSGTEIYIPSGAVKTIAKLTAKGRVEKTGAGKIVIGADSVITGGLVVCGGSVSVTRGPSVVVESCVAKEPALHLDAVDSASQFRFQEGGTNFVAAWQDSSGRAGAYATSAYTKNVPFLNTWDMLNGLPVIDFGEQANFYVPNDGRWFAVAPQVENARAVYVVYGSQANGGQMFGSTQGTIHDFGRGATDPTLDTALFGGGSEALLTSEIYTNGVRIASAQAHTFKPTGGYQLIELHLSRGLKFSGFATYSIASYLHGGCRMGEVIVYERPLTEREKVATRNYLLGKWFPETPLAELPDEPEIEPLAGSLSYDAGATWNVAVAADGTTADNMAVTGTLAFGANAKISLTGLTAFTEEQLKSLKVVIAKAGAYEGLDDVSVTGDVEFTRGTQPRLVARANGDLVVRFGQSGLTLIFY